MGKFNMKIKITPLYGKVNRILFTLEMHTTNSLEGTKRRRVNQISSIKRQGNTHTHTRPTNTRYKSKIIASQMENA